MNREEWHKFFVENKDRFTDSITEAKEKNKIYVEKVIDRMRYGKSAYNAIIDDYRFEKGICDKD